MVKDNISFTILVVVFLNVGLVLGGFFDTNLPKSSCQLLRNVNPINEYSPNYLNNKLSSKSHNETTRELLINALRNYANGEFQLEKVMNSSKIGSIKPIIIVNFIATGANPNNVPCQGKFPINEDYDYQYSEDGEICCQDPSEEEKETESPDKYPPIPIKNDPNDPKYEDMAKYVLEKSKNKHLLFLKVKRAQTHTVHGGFNHDIGFDAANLVERRLYGCNAKLYESIKAESRILKYSCYPKNSHEIENRNNLDPSDKGQDEKRNGDTIQNDIGGGWFEEDFHDPKFEKLAIYAMEKKGERLLFKKVTRAQSHLVSGKIYKIDFKAFENFGDSYTCQTELYQPIQGDIEVLKLSCLIDPYTYVKEYHDARTGFVQEKELVCGGWAERNPNDPQYKKLVLYAIEKRGKNKYNFSRVNRAQTQIVNGENFKIEFEAYKFNESRQYICKVELYQSFQGYIKISKFGCAQSIFVNLWVDYDPTELRWKKLAKFVLLKKYSEKLHLIKVKRAQVFENKQKLEIIAIDQEKRIYFCNTEVIQNSGSEKRTEITAFNCINPRNYL